MVQRVPVTSLHTLPTPPGRRARLPSPVSVRPCGSHSSSLLHRCWPAFLSLTLDAPKAGVRLAAKTTTASKVQRPVAHPGLAAACRPKPPLARTSVNGGYGLPCRRRGSNYFERQCWSRREESERPLCADRNYAHLPRSRCYRPRSGEDWG